MESLLMKRLLVKRYNRFSLFIILAIINLNTLIYGQADSLTYPPNSLQVIPSLNFKNTDIRDILRAIALEYKTNIVVDNNVNCKVSVALFKISVIDAIEIIAADNNYEFDYDANRFFVKTISEKPKPKPKKEELSAAQKKLPAGLQKAIKDKEAKSESLVKASESVIRTWEAATHKMPDGTIMKGAKHKDETKDEANDVDNGDEKKDTKKKLHADSGSKLTKVETEPSVDYKN